MQVRLDKNQDQLEERSDPRGEYKKFYLPAYGAVLEHPLDPQKGFCCVKEDILWFLIEGLKREIDDFEGVAE